MTTAIDNQIYDQLANTWWDENEFLHLLKAMVNPWRVPYFKTTLNRYHGEDLSGIHLLDVGCGGGVLAEEFASMGCRVTGIDISPRSIAVAQTHAALTGLTINYKVGSATSLPFDDHSFDAVSCCDVLEHLDDWRQAIAESARVLRPGGLFFFDTINRTSQSRTVMIYGLQESPLTRLMPPNTHIWDMFISPGEISEALRAYGMQVKEMKGGEITKNPLATLWNVLQQKSGRISFGELGRRLKLELNDNLSLNYLGYARKAQ